jgi:hypothetical protein
MSLESIKKGARGEAVADWQYFLLGRGIYKGEVHGEFDDATHRATVAFQKNNNLSPVDGWVGTSTYAVALGLGFDPLVYTLENSKDFPGPPDFKPLTVAEKHKLFGTIQFVDAPTKSNPEAVRISNGWEKNITQVSIPQLVGLEGTGRAKTFSFHKKIAEQVQALFQAWDDAGLKKYLLTYAGDWAPRYVRGSRTTLSSHAWGTAFDINAAWNMRGSRAAARGTEGSVRELVLIAYEHGFYWGGYFQQTDGMHFEATKIL